jgi:hypothetical protein
VSRFLKKKYWTRRTTTRRDPYQLSDEYINDCLEFIKEVRNMKLKDENIFVMDETRVWDDSHFNYSYAPRGR